MNYKRLMELLTPYFWRIIFTLAGFGVAMSFLTLGAGTTIFILLCCTIGYLLGVVHDKHISLTNWIKDLRGKL